MSFDDVLQPRRRGDEDSPKPKPASKPNSSAKAGSSLFENLDIQQIGRQMGLSDELTQQVIVPLVAILDKHISPQIGRQHRICGPFGHWVGVN